MIDIVLMRRFALLFALERKQEMQFEPAIETDRFHFAAMRFDDSNDARAVPEPIKRRKIGAAIETRLIGDDRALRFVTKRQRVKAGR